MTKFNKPDVRPAVASPVKSERSPSGTTALGHAGYVRNAQSEMFLLAISDFAGEKTFHEKSQDRLARYDVLTRQLARDEPDWLVRFVRWLRAEGNIRSAPIVIACTAIHERFTQKLAGHNRELTRAAILRADELGEMLGYWFSHFGRTIPNSMKRGLGDKIIELGTEFNYVKWGTSEARNFKFADVLNLSHPGDRKNNARQFFQGQWQHDLFSYAVKKPHEPELSIPESLDLLTRREALGQLPVNERREMLEHLAASGELGRAGMTWQALAGWLQGPMDRQAWEAIIPHMGYMALLRNLRNFDQAKVSDEIAAKIAARLVDSEQVRKSRQFPFRFLAAHRNVLSVRWSYPLELALNHSLTNVPSLRGRNLILVDRSPSMWMQKMSEHSTMQWADAAAVFGVALALRAERADLIEFGGGNRRVKFQTGESMLRILERFTRDNGTDIPRAVKRWFDGHDRIVVVTDEQTQPGYLPSNMEHYGGMCETKIDDLVPQSVPLYMWNFGGYKYGATPSGLGNRHTFGGLSDASFRMIELTERGRNADWPF